MLALFIFSQNYPNLFDPKTNFRVFSVRINFIKIALILLNGNNVRKIIIQKLGLGY